MWVAVWMIMISDSPEEDNHISSEEKNMILKSLEEDQTSHLVSLLQMTMFFFKKKQLSNLKQVKTKKTFL